MSESSDRRRASDRRHAADRRAFFRRAGDALHTTTWEDLRSQYLTRYLFWVLGIIYFHAGENVARSAEFLRMADIALAIYFVLTTATFVHAWRKPVVVWRWRLAMWTDLVGISACVVADANVASPTYFVFLAVILGNGMRYGIRAFGEAVMGSFLMGFVIFGLRFAEYISALSPGTLFFMMLGAIVVLYSYSLMARLERNRQQLEILSHVDVLTGLLNRRGLEDRARSVMRVLARPGNSVAMLFADLDGFKAVNDGQGHAVGDRVLREVAGLITANIRAGDVVARYGGDEFVVLMPDTDLEAARLAAERLQGAMAQWSRDSATSLSLSIGLGVAPDHGPTFDDLVRRVDQAMYRSKQRGGKGGIQVVGIES